jgi:uncharacterized membrane protein YdbT with pleckstrin-like domain
MCLSNTCGQVSEVVNTTSRSHEVCAGNDIYAAVLAVVAANIVLVSYIIVAALEERKATPATKPEETKKEK